MASLSADLQRPKSSLIEFQKISTRVLNYLPEVITSEQEFGDYTICSSTAGGFTKTIRPFHKDIFLRDVSHFEDSFSKLIELLNQTSSGQRVFPEKDYNIVDRVIYTIQQSMGIGLDLTVESNSARKHVGNRFEELIRAILREMGVAIEKIVLNIPYESSEGQKFYRCETDIVISPFDAVKSTPTYIHPEEIVVSLKTTTKDRMPKIFIDKILMSKFLDHEVQVVGISLNDIQRKEEANGTKIASTFVSNLFMVYTKFLTQLSGYYYLDMPRRALESPFNRHIFRFSQFILKDIWKLLGS
ncbi:hypothetical protein GF337_02435 [candidate division KSB1 bacterium]|nr:hypothetical protein [candidate division KSB1 bacterium]